MQIFVSRTNPFRNRPINHSTHCDKDDGIEVLERWRYCDNRSRTINQILLIELDLLYNGILKILKDLSNNYPDLDDFLYL